MNRDSKIFVAGHKGLAGSAIIRQLNRSGYKNLVTADRSKLDLEDISAVRRFMQSEKPECVFMAAAKVGGILANSTFPVDFLLRNLKIQNSIIEASFESKVQRLLFLGSSCIYPKFSEQPIRESSLLTGSLEETNRAYAIAKIAGIELCWSYNRQYKTQYLAAMPTNLYGIGDNYDLNASHVLPALIRKFHEAKVTNKKTVEIWGTGTPRREFLLSDDLAAALVHLAELSDDKFSELVAPAECPIINIGTGNDLPIKELAALIQKTVGFEGDLTFNTSKPDGTPRKVLDVSKILSFGWQSRIDLETGLRIVYDDFLGRFGKN
ncbi:MAG: GDP-L-fucose synthase family protein [Bdellovibrionales bacterium]